MRLSLNIYTQLFVKYLPWVLCILMFIFLNKGCRDAKLSTSLYKATQDSLVVERNEKGQQKASIELLLATTQKQFEELRSNDSTIQKLQVLVKKTKNLLTATVLTNITTINNSSTTGTIKPKDTLMVGDKSYIYPQYLDTIKNKWYTGVMSMDKDSSKLNLVVRNEFEFVQSMEKQNKSFAFLRPKIAKTSILNLNPYTETKELRTFTVKCECNNTNWFIGGVATGVVGSILLNKIF